MENPFKIDKDVILVDSQLAAVTGGDDATSPDVVSICEACCTRIDCCDDYDFDNDDNG